MNTTELVVEIGPKKNSGPYGPEFFFQTGLISSTSSVVFIIARIASIFISLTAVPIYDFICHYSENWKVNL